MTLCPWCYAQIVAKMPDKFLTAEEARKAGYARATSFAAHVQRCPDAPESVKGAYRT